jgi:hypothetical protein
LIDYHPQFTRLPTDREECWSKLAHFVEFWHKVSCDPANVTRDILRCEARLHVTLPEAVIEWHTRFSRFINLWDDIALTLPLDDLNVHQDTLVVRTEPVFKGLMDAHWGIPLEEIESPDPPVVLILQTRMHPCADRVSHFAVISAMYDTVMLARSEQHCVSSPPPFLSDGTKMEFPASFGIIETEMYEGRNWLALASGTDVYFRQRDPRSGIGRSLKTERSYNK